MLLPEPAFSAMTGSAGPSDPIKFAFECANAGVGFALVTLTEVVGSGPRRVGTQLCINAKRQCVGSLSGGCLDHAVIEEAIAAINTRANRLLHFGPGSPNEDLNLPCGSQLRLRLDCDIALTTWQDLLACKQQRQPYWLYWRADQLQLSKQPVASSIGYLPSLLLHVAGNGPALLSFARLALAADLELLAYSRDGASASALRALGVAVNTEFTPGLDAYAAAITLFHEHENEDAFLQHALKQEAFYIGAMGSARAQQARLARLKALDATLELAKLRAHIGVIARTRTPQMLALSVLTELMQCYEQLHADT